MGLLEDLQHAFNVDGHQPLNEWSDVADELATIIETYPDFDSKNYIINGAMDIAQRGTSFSSVANGTYTLDRWKYHKSGAAAHTVTQDTDVPSNSIFTKSVKLDCTTADTSIAATDGTSFRQHIEGYVFKNLVGKTATLSFWVKATKVGIYCVSFFNSGSDRSYVSEFTINETETWEYKTITVTFDYSDGTWNYTNGIGLTVNFTLAIGSDYYTTPNTWQNGIYVATSNQVNGTDSTDNNFWLTGVVLNEGTEAAPYQPFGGTYESDFQACERRYKKSYALADPPGTDTVNGSVQRQARATNAMAGFEWQRMADIPTVTIYSTNGTANKVTTAVDVDIGTSVTALSVGAVACRSLLDSGSGLTSGVFYQFHYTLECEL